MINWGYFMNKKSGFFVHYLTKSDLKIFKFERKKSKNFWCLFRIFWKGPILLLDTIPQSFSIHHAWVLPWYEGFQTLSSSLESSLKDLGAKVLIWSIIKSYVYWLWLVEFKCCYHLSFTIFEKKLKVSNKFYSNSFHFK